MTVDERVEQEQGRPLLDILREEAEAGNYTRLQVAEELGITVPQLDYRLKLLDMGWPRTTNRGVVTIRRWIREGHEWIGLAEWCRRNSVPYQTGVRWHRQGKFEDNQHTGEKP